MGRSTSLEGARRWGILVTWKIVGASTRNSGGRISHCSGMASESLRQVLRAEVVLAVGPAAAPGLCWSDCQLPTLRDVSCLRPNFSTARLGVEVLFEDNSAATAFEASDGNWEGVAAGLAAPLWRPSLHYSHITSFPRLPMLPPAASTGAAGAEFLLGLSHGDALCKCYPWSWQPYMGS